MLLLSLKRKRIPPPLSLVVKKSDADEENEEQKYDDDGDEEVDTPQSPETPKSTIISTSTTVQDASTSTTLTTSTWSTYSPSLLASLPLPEETKTETARLSTTSTAIPSTTFTTFTTSGKATAAYENAKPAATTAGTVREKPQGLSPPVSKFLISLGAIAGAAALIAIVVLFYIRRRRSQSNSGDDNGAEDIGHTTPETSQLTIQPVAPLAMARTAQQPQPLASNPPTQPVISPTVLSQARSATRQANSNPFIDPPVRRAYNRLVGRRTTPDYVSPLADPAPPNYSRRDVVSSSIWGT